MRRYGDSNDKDLHGTVFFAVDRVAGLACPEKVKRISMYPRHMNRTLENLKRNHFKREMNHLPTSILHGIIMGYGRSNQASKAGQ